MRAGLRPSSARCRWRSSRASRCRSRPSSMPASAREVVARVERLEPQPDGCTLADIALGAGDRRRRCGATDEHAVRQQLAARRRGSRRSAGAGGAGRAFSRAASRDRRDPRPDRGARPTADLHRAEADRLDAGRARADDGASSPTPESTSSRTTTAGPTRALASFEQRVVACQREVEHVNRGRATRTLYAPALSGDAEAMREQLEFAQGHGVAMVLIDADDRWCVELQRAAARVPGDGVPGAPRAWRATRSRRRRCSGTLFRLFGADAVIFPNHGGRFIYTRSTCGAIAARLREPLAELQAGAAGARRWNVSRTRA